MVCRILLFVLMLAIMLSLIDCYKLTKTPSSLLLSSSSSVNNMNRHRFSVNLCSKNELKDFSINMKSNDNDDNLVSTSISNNNRILKYSLITMSSVLLMPMIALAADNDSVLAFQIARPILDISVNLLSFLFICRTVISWYPKTDLNAFPYNIAAWPTEPLLAPVRDLVPPAFGVDVSSIVWVAVLSFLREILTGQQGILTLIEKSG